MTHIGREYAAALFSCARETGERFSDALCAVETLFADNPQYVALLSSPAVALSEREELIKKAFSDAAEEHYAALYRALPAERRKR